MERHKLELLLGGGDADTAKAHRALLQSIAVTTRAACAAQACSIQRLDLPARQLIFEAVAGQGEDSLPGFGYPADRGIAGWTLMSRQSIAVDDVSNEPNFARDVAESTGYVPRSIAAFPLVSEDAPLGVMEVLDCQFEARRGIDCLDFIAPFAAQAAIVLRLLQRDREVGAAVAADRGLCELSDLTAMLSSLGAERRGVAVKLVELLRELM